MAGSQSSRNVERVRARSPLDPSKEITLRVDTDTVGKLSEIASTHKLYQMYYNVCGYPPPVNNVGYYERNSGVVDASNGILDAHIIFQGLKRPHIDENGDKSVYIYITKPKYLYKYKPGMACVVARDDFPAGAVFASYVKLDHENGTGEVFNWELIKSDSGNNMWPENHDNRYDSIRWQL